MDNNFFSGSENLYKYFVSIGILMLVLTIYYPLKEKQDLEILKISLESELKVLNFEIKENSKNVSDLTKSISKKNIDPLQVKKIYTEISHKQKTNQVKQLIAEGKIIELESRKKYINIYDNLFWIFIVAGSGLMMFGFIKWQKSKKVDDDKCEIELELLRLKLSQERQNNTDISNNNDNSSSNNPINSPTS